MVFWNFCLIVSTLGHALCVDIYHFLLQDFNYVFSFMVLLQPRPAFDIYHSGL
jgi:hypothetical protein